jgi:hypothetical protein
MQDTVIYKIRQFDYVRSASVSNLGISGDRPNSYWCKISANRGSGSSPQASFHCPDGGFGAPVGCAKPAIGFKMRSVAAIAFTDEFGQSFL